jgi:hypothetical protein
MNYITTPKHIPNYDKASSLGTGAKRCLRKLFKLGPIASLSILTACGAPKIEAGSHPDRRTPIPLTSQEAEDLRAGMRIYLASIQGIVDALPRNRMDAVATSAKGAGMGMIGDIPASVALKLPPRFIVLSIDTHQKFDALSRLAESSGTKAAILTSLQEILANCTACHSSYRVP